MKILIGLFLFMVSFLTFAQVESSPVDATNAVGGIIQLFSKLLVDKPSLSVVILVFTQIVIMVLRTNWLDNAVGKVKMPIISGVAILIPACTFMIANPTASFAQIIADGATLAALQVFGHQLYQHIIGDKKNK